MLGTSMIIWYDYCCIYHWDRMFTFRTIMHGSQCSHA